ncbi:uncharacterized protein YALI1_D08983g [Yarrowia lipolytica]|uniref:Uncharacterized protein n=1 Tax=Yarrowia lipolytica TaxID=4952 RepID=A0A1D8NDJ2_YARLL|nr:hypothetical protein YALI1_D08983g [Yarrowia lipolytica]
MVNVDHSETAVCIARLMSEGPSRKSREFDIPREQLIFRRHSNHVTRCTTCLVLVLALTPGSSCTVTVYSHTWLYANGRSVWHVTTPTRPTPSDCTAPHGVKTNLTTLLAFS